MPRNLSVTAKRAIFDQFTDEVFLLLLKIEHSDLPAPILLVQGFEEVNHNGETYIPFPFKIGLPNQHSDQLSRVTLLIDNIDRAILFAIRQITTPPSVSLNIVLASDPETVEAGPFLFTWRETTYTSAILEAKLDFEDTLNEQFPAASFTPSRFPALF